MKDKLLSVCENKCWCEFCKEEIQKGDKFLNIWKNAFKGTTRTNICSLCLEKINKEINKKDLRAIKKRLILKRLE